ncbi:MAG: transposase family protein [Deltaproteobacteria bacterium]|nr:transposase family protein [Deltaproteobacteria bacterium]
MKEKETLRSLYHFPGFEAFQELKPHLKDPGARVVTLQRIQNKNICSSCQEIQNGYYDSRWHCIRDLSCGGTRIYVEFEYRRILCHKCGAVKQEALPWVAACGRFTRRFEDEIGRQCKDMSIKRVAEVNHLGWAQVQRMDRSYLPPPLRRPLLFDELPEPGPENNFLKARCYRVTVFGVDYSWFLRGGGKGQDQMEPETFFVELLSRKGQKANLVVLNTGKPFRKSMLTIKPLGLGRRRLVHTKLE